MLFFSQNSHSSPRSSRTLVIFPDIWEKREDSEFTQALIRLTIGIFAFGYLYYTSIQDGTISGNDRYTLTTAGVFFVGALTIILWLLRQPGINVPRRICGILLDNSAITIALFFHGVLGTPLFVIYLWVSFGNGFRYGQKYLALSATCGVVGFLLVTTSSSYFQNNPYLTHGLLLGLIVLPLYIASLLHQLTKSLEIAENANRAKSNFLATMSHEIRTPLNGLVGITDLLGKTDLTSQQQHYVDLISRSSEWLMRVITDGLDFSKIEANEFLLTDDTFDLPQTLMELCLLYEGMQKSKEVNFTYNLSEELPKHVQGDQLRLTQILGNLLSNAVKFTEKGEISFQTELKRKYREKYEITFTVTDTGPGISEEEQTQIFEPFKQVKAHPDKHVSGTGLGLAIAHGLVDLMGGELVLTSEVGVGSSFSLSLTFEARTQEKSIRTETPQLFLHWESPPSILLVEDHEINREVIANQLMEMGCEVSFAKNGKEAISRIENNRYDLVFMDCQMPVMDGYRATQEIRRFETEAARSKKVPIIALTAHVTVDDRQKCLECGMDDYLGKPFRVEDLRVKLHHWLGSQLSKNTPQSPLKEPFQETRKRSRKIPEHERKILHDLRNALFVIQANTGFACDANISTAQRQAYTELIVEAVDRAIQHLNDLNTARKN